MIYFPTLGNGRTWYETSTLHAERASHWWFVYDPIDLAQVAQGQKQQWEIQPRNTWQNNYPGLSRPLPGWADEPKNMITGATYDPTTRRLFVAVRFGWSTGGAGENGHTIYVYRVNSIPTTAATVDLSGRVTNVGGRGIAQVRVSLADSNGETRLALTNGFGYYRFTGVTAGAPHTLTLRHKRYSFNPNQQILTLLENVDNLDFSSVN